MLDTTAPPAMRHASAQPTPPPLRPPPLRPGASVGAELQRPSPLDPRVLVAAVDVVIYHVPALAGSPAEGWTARLAEQAPLLGYAARLHTALALKHSGHPREAAALLPSTARNALVSATAIFEESNGGTAPLRRIT